MVQTTTVPSCSLACRLSPVMVKLCTFSSRKYWHIWLYAMPLSPAPMFRANVKTHSTSSSKNRMLPGRTLRLSVTVFPPLYSCHRSNTEPAVPLQKGYAHQHMGPHIFHRDEGIVPGARIPGAGAVISQEKQMPLRHRIFLCRWRLCPAGAGKTHPAPPRLHTHSRPESSQCLRAVR